MDNVIGLGVCEMADMQEAAAIVSAADVNDFSTGS